MIKHIIFDLDGTLLNTLTDLANSCNFALASNGFPTHPEESYKLFVGGGRDNLIHRALGDFDSEENFQLVGKAFDGHYKIHSQDETRPYDGVLPLLQKLREAKIGCAVVSNKPDAPCQVLVPKYFGDLLSPVLGSRPEIAPKPNPQLVFEAMEAMGAQPDTTLYIGDSGVDMETAVNSGLPPVGVLWGFRGREELVEGGAVHLCETIEALESLIFSL